MIINRIQHISFCMSLMYCHNGQKIQSEIKNIK